MCLKCSNHTHRQRMEPKKKDFEGTGKLYAPQEQLKDVARVQELDESVGQGSLYAPPKRGTAVIQASKEVASDVRAALVLMRDTVMEKLAVLPLPVEAMEAGRKSMENLIKEVSHTYDNAKGAVQKTKDRIAESIMPPNPAKDASQVAEEVDHTVLENTEGRVPETHHSKAYESVTSGSASADAAKIKARL
ncbi:uncharacterized protein LOC112346133 [Selaginella moellendorffii]|uniref:uncharacterized protein LOC112346133 n=1 Tax=Selaginella moellendorffii TaxID=88036 RepID=UPI000D1C6F16|nr:uncharacterized protein LOC112346133 [Selaginella moellendorffii]|eukprot:XP_024530088.1 uncharacterized protein LOC112346133 [Selaginella moellendorffii]